MAVVPASLHVSHRAPEWWCRAAACAAQVPVLRTAFRRAVGDAAAKEVRVIAAWYTFQNHDCIPVGFRV